jgi:mRNA-degrading endonuclease RelE of RelBE toxin-antitoxin system
VKKRFEWSPQARSDLKEIEREQAMQILMRPHATAKPGKETSIINILAVGHRSEAYR